MVGVSPAASAAIPVAVIPEADIWRSALAMVRRYKVDAMLEAAMGADQLLEDGDWRGCRDLAPDPWRDRAAAGAEAGGGEKVH